MPELNSLNVNMINAIYSIINQYVDDITEPKVENAYYDGFNKGIDETFRIAFTEGVASERMKHTCNCSCGNTPVVNETAIQKLDSAGAKLAVMLSEEQITKITAALNKHREHIDIKNRQIVKEILESEKD